MFGDVKLHNSAYQAHSSAMCEIVHFINMSGFHVRKTLGREVHN